MHPERIVLWSSGPGDTRAIAAAVATCLGPGDVVALSGELGAGKTCFVQGAAGALGIADRVTSPTFTLVRTYEGADVPVVHCDVYRLDTLQDVLDLGEEVLAPDVVTFLEWADAIEPLLPSDRLDVELLLEDPHDPGAERRIVLRGLGRFGSRIAALRDRCASWTREA